MQLCGGLLGLAIGWIVDEALVEISLNGLFSVLFGVLLAAIAALILARTRSGRNGGPPSRARGCVVAFALFVLAAAVSCILLDKQWVAGLSPSGKLPLYALLGCALAFALTFAVVDVLNFFSTACPSIAVRSSSQLCAVLLGCILLGGYAGLLFGSLDVEDDASAAHVRFHEDARGSLPVAACIGLLVGFLQQRLARPPTRVAYSGLPTKWEEDTAVEREDAALLRSEEAV
eukprot:PLAT8981.2.p1 GENE.PLAT8981.2~~PLAT8981.2.p1  ORF type:complete len:254 (+),score=57.25 PLAT8981.2:72-764(+)